MNKKRLLKLLAASLVCVGLLGSTGYASGSEGGLNLYSIKVPNKVEQYVQNNYKHIIAPAKLNPAQYGLENTKDMQIGQGFNIFEMNSGKLKDNKVYYYPVLSKNKIQGVIAIIENDNGSMSGSFTTEFTTALDNLTSNNSNTPYVLYSCNGKIYAVNKDKKTKLSEVFISKKTLAYDVYASYDQLVNEAKQNKEVITEDIKKNQEKSYDLGNTYGSYASKVLNVPITAQTDQSGKARNLCWAAASSSIIQYKTGKNVPAYSIADMLKIPYDSGGYPIDAIKALKTYGVSSTSADVLSNDRIKEDIAGNKPIWMASMAPAGLGHATVIDGYTEDQGKMTLHMMNSATRSYQTAYSDGRTYSYVMANIRFTWTNSIELTN